MHLAEMLEGHDNKDSKHAPHKGEADSVGDVDPRAGGQLRHLPAELILECIMSTHDMNMSHQYQTSGESLSAWGSIKARCDSP